MSKMHYLSINGGYILVEKFGLSGGGRPVLSTKRLEGVFAETYRMRLPDYWPDRQDLCGIVSRY
jgi:hypothetical protein